MNIVYTCIYIKHSPEKKTDSNMGDEEEYLNLKHLKQHGRFFIKYVISI